MTPDGLHAWPIEALEWVLFVALGAWKALVIPALWTAYKGAWGVSRRLQVVMLRLQGRWNGG